MHLEKDNKAYNSGVRKSTNKSIAYMPNLDHGQLAPIPSGCSFWNHALNKAYQQ
jgi:hypothetical protein